MKNYLLITFSLYCMVFNLNAQITGQFFDEAVEIPGVTVKIPDKNIFTQSDFDGNFSLEIMNSKVSDLEFIYGDLIIKIENINLDIKDKITLGKIILPSLKFVSIKEYSLLNEKQKESCNEIRHWAQLLGYEKMNELSEDYLLLTCDGINRAITNFTFNSSSRTIFVDWKELVMCN